jgi:methionyl-tRNA formyltransferase
MDIQILVDNTNSWVLPCAKKMVLELSGMQHNVELIGEHKELKKGDCLILLSCEKILKSEQLSLHKHNLVVHASALPDGRGWSPLTWQILEGKNVIPITLFEAALAVDAGSVYAKMTVEFLGHELIDELREKISEASIQLIKEFTAKYPNVLGVVQNGVASFYPKRLPKDSALNIDKTIREQFNLFRISDNERYPAYFELHGFRYSLKIEKI